MVFRILNQSSKSYLYQAFLLLMNLSVNSYRTLRSVSTRRRLEQAMSEIEKGTLDPKQPTHIVDDKPPSDEGSEDQQRKDVAFSVYLQARQQTISLEEGNRVRRKIDLHLMPYVLTFRGGVLFLFFIFIFIFFLLTSSA
jgi:hypothetical protein